MRRSSPKPNILKFSGKPYKTKPSPIPRAQRNSSPPLAPRSFEQHPAEVYCFPSVGEKRELPLLVSAAGGTWRGSRRGIRVERPEVCRTRFLSDLRSKQLKQSRGVWFLWGATTIRGFCCLRAPQSFWVLEGNQNRCANLGCP